MSAAGGIVEVKSILDSIWTAQDRRAAAECKLGDLTNFDWLLLGAWDTAAICAPSGGSLRLSPPADFLIEGSLLPGGLRGRIVRAGAGTEEPPFLRFDGTPWRVLIVPSGALSSKANISHDPVSLLIAMELIRDHLDSPTLHPPALRRHAVTQQALEARIEDAHYLSLAAWFSEVLPVLCLDDTHANSY